MRADFVSLGDSCLLPQFIHTHRLLSKVREDFSRENTSFENKHLHRAYEGIRLNVALYFKSHYPHLKLPINQRISGFSFEDYVLQNPRIGITDFLPSQKERYAWGQTGNDEDTKDQIGLHIPNLRADMCRTFENTFHHANPDTETLHLRSLLATLVTTTYLHETCYSFLHVSLTDILAASQIPATWRTPDMNQMGFAESGLEIEGLMFCGGLLVFWPEEIFGDLCKMEIFHCSDTNSTKFSRLRLIPPDAFRVFYDCITGPQGFTMDATRALSIAAAPEDESKADVERRGILARLQTPPVGDQSRDVLPDPLSCITDDMDGIVPWGGACRRSKVMIRGCRY